MTVRKTQYVAASDIKEAWLRFRSGLYSEYREVAQARAEELEHDDYCDPKCKYCVWEVHVDIHVDEGPESDPCDEWGYDDEGNPVDLR